jgi:hypothetical protein
MAVTRGIAPNRPGHGVLNEKHLNTAGFCTIRPEQPFPSYERVHGAIATCA